MKSALFILIFLNCYVQAADFAPIMSGKTDRTKKIQLNTSSDGTKLLVDKKLYKLDTRSLINSFEYDFHMFDNSGKFISAASDSKTTNYDAVTGKIYGKPGRVPSVLYNRALVGNKSKWVAVTEEGIAFVYDFFAQNLEKTIVFGKEFIFHNRRSGALIETSADGSKFVLMSRVDGEVYAIVYNSTDFSELSRAKLFRTPSDIRDAVNFRFIGNNVLLLELTETSSRVTIAYDIEKKDAEEICDVTAWYSDKLPSDGNEILVCEEYVDDKRRVKILSLKNLTEIYELPERTNLISVSLDQKYIVYSHLGEPVANVLNMQTRQVVSRFKIAKHHFASSSYAISPDNSKFVVSAINVSGFTPKSSLKIYDLLTGVETQDLSSSISSDASAEVTFSPNGKFLVAKDIESFVVFEENNK